jgi:hypothetical protein
MRAQSFLVGYHRSSQNIRQSASIKNFVSTMICEIERIISKKRKKCFCFKAQHTKTILATRDWEDIYPIWSKHGWTRFNRKWLNAVCFTQRSALAGSFRLNERMNVHKCNHQNKQLSSGIWLALRKDLDDLGINIHKTRILLSYYDNSYFCSLHRFSSI